MKRCVSREAIIVIFEGTVEPSLLYGPGVWVIYVHERK